MNRLLSTFLLLFAVGVAAYGQYGFGTNAPDPSAVLDMTSANKGVLIPRVALTATNVAAPVSAPAVNLLVFNTASASTGTTAVSPGFYYWNGSVWVPLLNSISGWTTTGNSGTTPGTNFLGTNDAQDLVMKTNGPERMRVLGSGGTVSIGSAPASPASALLSLSSTTKGLLLPRLTKNEISAISNPAVGLIVYNKDDACLSYYDGYFFRNLRSFTDVNPPVVSYLGATYTTLFNGVGTAGYASSGTTKTYTAGEPFSSVTGCQSAVVSVTGCGGELTMTGASGYRYPLVEINGQCWFGENLTEQPTNPSLNAGNNGAYYVYGNSGWPGPAEGYLYQWNAAMNGSATERAQGVCPAGFHIPSDCEWMYLEHGLGTPKADLAASSARGATVMVDSKLMTPVDGALYNNTSGFGGLLTGVSFSGSSFSGRGPFSFFTGWWSSTASGSNAYVHKIDKDYSGTSDIPIPVSYGYSVRCLKN